MNHQLFWNLLFDEDDMTCFSVNAYGTATARVNAIVDKRKYNFFSINATHIRRLDDNVYKFRNFLLEFDELDLAKQREIINTIPHSTIVFSGGKSLHVIISLETPLENKQQYNLVAKALLKKVKEADPSTKNPSRFSRTPGAMRGVVEQSLIYTGNRIDNKDFSTWLGPIEQEDDYVNLGNSLHTSPWTKYYLWAGANKGERNSSLYKAACDLLRCGYSTEDIKDLVFDIADLPLSEISNTIKSAEKMIRRAE